MKSIALICGSTPGQGIYGTGITLYEALRTLGYEVTWYQCIDGRYDKEPPSEHKVVRGTGIFGHTLSMGINRLILFPWKLKSLNADLVLLLDPTLLRVSKEKNRTVVKVQDLRAFTEHSDRFATRLMFRFIMPKVNKVRAVLVATRFMESVMFRYGFRNPTTYVIPETAPFEGTGRKHILESIERVKKGSIRILYVATDRPYKNIRFFIHIAKMLLKEKEISNFHFDLVTNPSKTTQIESAKLDPNHFHIHTFVTDEKLFEIYDGADVLLFPSLYEGFGLPLLEAMSFGIPIISNNINPMIEVLSDSSNLIDVNHPSDWALVIRQMLDVSNYKKAAEMSLARFALYSKGQYVSKVRTIFQELSTP